MVTGSWCLAPAGTAQPVDRRSENDDRRSTSDDLAVPWLLGPFVLALQSLMFYDRWV
jgi:hypothetical protein